jgi:hypothetical protein
MRFSYHIKLSHRLVSLVLVSAYQFHLRLAVMSYRVDMNLTKTGLDFDASITSCAKFSSVRFSGCGKCAKG